MSLYTFIHDRADVRQGFGARLLQPRVRFRRGLQARPLTANDQLVGGAFRYLLRFHVQRINPEARVSPWIAEAAADLIGTGSSSTLGGEVPTPSSHPRGLRAAAYVADAKRRCEIYIADGEVTDQLLVAAYRLAHLDLAARAGPDRIDWRSINYLRADDASDLKALLELVDESVFRATRACIVDPPLRASSLVGGADPDFILDYCLVAVNTSHKPGMDVREIYRLVGCYLLLGLAGIDREHGKAEQWPVNAIGIYFARFGQLWKVPIREIVAVDSVPELTRWFVAAACESNPRARDLLREYEGPLAAHLAKRQGPAGEKTQI